MSRPAAKPQTLYDIWKPPEQRPLRQLPGLLASSFGLLWSSARTEFVLVAIVQVVSGAMGGTVLLISHRFSSVRSADRIYVLHKGHLVEQGTHNELMQLNGQDAELFTLQAAAYQSNGVAAVTHPEAVG